MAEWRKLLVYQLEALRQLALEINLMPPLQYQFIDYGDSLFLLLLCAFALPYSELKLLCIKLTYFFLVHCVQTC